MKTKKMNKKSTYSTSKVAKVLMLPLLMVFLSQCELYELPEAEPYIGEFDMTMMEWLPTHVHADGSNDFTMLIEALEITGLDELLASESVEYTLFAPGNISWKLFLRDHDYETMQDVPVDELRDILLYNMMDGKHLRQDFTVNAEQYPTKLADHFLTISYVDFNTSGRYYDMVVNTRKVATQNIQFTNGVIHAYAVTGMQVGSAGEGAVQLIIP